MICGFSLHVLHFNRNLKEKSHYLRLLSPKALLCLGTTGSHGLSLSPLFPMQGLPLSFLPKSLPRPLHFPQDLAFPPLIMESL